MEYVIVVVLLITLACGIWIFNRLVSDRNLVAQGVLQPYAGRRDPQPFPSAFVPDPWR